MSKPKLPETPEAFSLDEKPLFPMPIYPEHLALQHEGYVKALADWEENSENAENIIWLGRRTAYLSRFRESIAIYTLGVEARLRPPNASPPRTPIS